MEISKKSPFENSTTLKMRDLSSRKTSIPKEYLEVANGMEVQFIDHMLTEMDKSIPKESEESSATNFYKSQLNYERAKAMADSYLGSTALSGDHEKGIGLKKVILEQIYPHYKNSVSSSKNNISKGPAIITHQGDKNE